MFTVVLLFVLFQGKDIFQLIDEMSVQIKHDLKIPAYHIEEIEDLPVSEMLTNSLSAFRLFVTGNYTINLKNDLEAAASSLEQAVEVDPTFALAWGMLSAFYKLFGQEEKAETSLQAAMQYIYKVPERLQFDFKYQYYLQKEDQEKAFHVVQNRVELFPDDIEGHAQLAGEYLKRRKSEMIPTAKTVNVYIGRCYRNLREFEKAEEYILKALKIHPFEPEANYEIALVYWDMDNKQKALEHLEKALYVWEDADPEYKPAKKARDKKAKWESVF